MGNGCYGKPAFLAFILVVKSSKPGQNHTLPPHGVLFMHSIQHSTWVTQEHARQARNLLTARDMVSNVGVHMHLNLYRSAVMLGVIPASLSCSTEAC